MALRHKTLRVLVALATITVLAALPAPAQASTLTQAQRDTIRNALVVQGASSDMIDTILSDESLALGVVTGTSYEETWGINGSGGVRYGMNVGSTCYGYSGWVQRIQYENNSLGNHLASITLHSDFCYNYSQVTYSTSDRSYHIFSLGQATVSWKGWDNFSEGWYAYNNHTNGGVRTATQGTFGQCVLNYGCIGSVAPIARTYSHYDGGWSTSGSS